MDDDGEELDDWDAREAKRMIRRLERVTSLLQPFNSMEIQQMYEIAVFLAKVQGWVIHSMQAQGEYGVTMLRYSSTNIDSFRSPVDLHICYRPPRVMASLHQQACLVQLLAQRILQDNGSLQASPDPNLDGKERVRGEVSEDVVSRNSEFG